jgi:hypothetical protein
MDGCEVTNHFNIQQNTQNNTQLYPNNQVQSVENGLYLEILQNLKVKHIPVSRGLTVRSAPGADLTVNPRETGMCFT